MNTMAIPYTYEFPAGSGKKMSLKQIANQLTKRILNIFKRNEEGKFQYHGDDQSAGQKNTLKNTTCSMNFFMVIRDRV
jgi:hypothetical protein